MLSVRQILVVLWCYFIILDVDVHFRFEATFTHGSVSTYKMTAKVRICMWSSVEYLHTSRMLLLVVIITTTINKRGDRNVKLIRTVLSYGLAIVEDQT